MTDSFYRKSMIVFLCCSFAMCDYGFGQDTERNSEEIGKLTATTSYVDLDPVQVTLVSLDGIGHAGTINLGEVPPGKRCRCAVSLNNLTEDEFKFTLIQSGCSCSKFKMEQLSIQSNESAIAILEFDVPDGTRDGNFGFRVDFFNGVNSAAGMLAVSMKLKGNLYISPQQTVYRIGEGVSRWKMPISFNDPVKRENLVVTPSKSFRDFTSEITQANGKTFLVLSLHETHFDSQYLFGSVKVQDKLVGSTAKAELMFAKKQPIVFSPRILRFRTEKIPESSDLSSSAGPGSRISVAQTILQIDSSLLSFAKTDQDPQAQNDTNLEVHCSIVDFDLPVKVEKLSNSIFRVMVTLPSDDDLVQLGKSAKNVSWRLSVNGKSFSMSNPFLTME